MTDDLPADEIARLTRENELLRKKAHDWNAEADKYLAERDELTVALREARATALEDAATAFQEVDRLNPKTHFSTHAWLRARAAAERKESP